MTRNCPIQTLMNRRRLGALLLAWSLALSACMSPEARRGVHTFGHGLVNLAMSPIMIVTGLAQGLAFLPYTIGTGLDELNKGLIRAQAISLDDAYRIIHSISIADPRVDPKTGQIKGQHFEFGQHQPEAIMDATSAFRRLLISQGMPQTKAEQYVLVGNYQHVRSQGHILLAVVYRSSGTQSFRVRSKDTNIVTTFRPDHQGWYAAYERDIEGHNLDEVIDWAGVEYEALKRDKVVAMLMVLAAESVKSGKRSPDYWQAEQRWFKGDTTSVIDAAAAKVKRVLPNA